MSADFVLATSSNATPNPNGSALRSPISSVTGSSIGFVGGSDGLNGSHCETANGLSQQTVQSKSPLDKKLIKAPSPNEKNNHLRESEVNNSVRSNSPEDSGPWCWQTKGALDHINKSIDNRGHVASARGVYVALTQIASDNASSIFTTTVARISEISALADKTVRERLHDLANIGLIKIELGRLKMPARYTLWAFGNKYRSSGNNHRSSGNSESPPVPSLEEREKRKKSPPPPPEEGDYFYAWAEKIFYAFPKKVARKDGIAAIMRAFKKATPEVLFRAVCEYTKTPGLNIDNKRWIPTATTFFDEDRWKDHVPRPVSTREVIATAVPSKGLEDFRVLHATKGLPTQQNQRLALIRHSVESLTASDLTLMTDTERTAIDTHFPGMLEILAKNK